MYKFFSFFSWILLIQLGISTKIFAQQLTPFNCPTMVGIVNEGPTMNNNPSYLMPIQSSTGATGSLISVSNVNTGAVYSNVNGIGINSQDGFGYAQHQRVPTEAEVIIGLLSGNYTSTSTLLQIGSNGLADSITTLVPPVNTGYNAHIVFGLLGTADNSGNYYTIGAEAQVNPIDTSVSSYQLYIGRVSVPSGAVTWIPINLDASCTAFEAGMIDALKTGQDRGAQDMVWDPTTNKLWLYAGIDKILGVVDIVNNTGSCYEDSNGTPSTLNLGGLAIDSVGQMIAMEVQTGRIIRIDTRGCTDGNPGTPCITSLTTINTYTVNGNPDTRGDAASCIVACVAPRITKNTINTCINKETTLDINVSGATAPYSYVWGNYSNNGTLSNTSAQDANYVSDSSGIFKAYVTVSDAKGCQQTDTITVIVNVPGDTTKISGSVCNGSTITFGNQTINSPGIYYATFNASNSCDSVVELTVTTSCSLTPFNCPTMVGIVNEGPTMNNNPSYLMPIQSSTGAPGNLISVSNVNTGAIYSNVNGIGINSQDGFGYAQYQRVPTEAEVIIGLLSGNYTSTSTLLQIGSNGLADSITTLVPPVNTGYNAHIVFGLLGTADNSGNYYTIGAEAQVNPIDTSVSSYQLYIGRVSVPSGAVTWIPINLDASCTAFEAGMIDALKTGQDRGAQDMVWDPTTNKLWLYAGIDRILGVVDIVNNTGSCYEDSNGTPSTLNLGGLAIDSVGQMIAMEVQTGRIIRIDTRGCTDGNPGTPCITSLTTINTYTVNGNPDTRGDAASCIVACVAPVLSKNNYITCVNAPITLSVSNDNTNSYTWGIYADNGILTNTNQQNATYVNSTSGSYTVYVTVENAQGCQKADSITVTVQDQPDTIYLQQSLCIGQDDSILFNNQIIKEAGVYVATFQSTIKCDSIVKLTVTEDICNSIIAIDDDTVSYGNPVVIPVINNDIDPTGSTISLCGGTQNDGIITPPTHGTATPNQDGTITYTPTIISGIDSFQYAICSQNGTDTAWVYITIEDCVIPNTFSPNGDGMNDYFNVPCIDGANVVLCVYNRWGAEVYRNEHYDNINNLFIGQYKGKDLPDGTYYYVLKYNNLQGKKIDRAGFVVIAR